MVGSNKSSFVHDVSFVLWQLNAGQCKLQAIANDYQTIRYLHVYVAKTIMNTLFHTKAV